MKPKTDSGKMKSMTILKLKLSLDSGQQAELERLSELCRKGLNAGSVNWLLRQNGLPLSQKQSDRLCQHVKHVGKPKSESSVIYHAVREGSPGLSATVHSMLANKIASYLAGRLDWREGKDESGKRPRRKDAILRGDARPPYFTAVQIPIRSSESKFSFADMATLNCRVSDSERLTVTIRTASLSRGQKVILRELAAGTRKLSDSYLTLRDDEWYWFVPVAFERATVVSDRQAVLSPVIPDPSSDQQLDRPYSLQLPERDRPWTVGDGRYLLAQTRRIETMRKMIGWRYRQRNGAGHGRSKVDAKMRSVAMLHANIVSEFRRRLIVDVVRQCEGAGCGLLVYREPSLPAREKCWFAAKGLEWNWTRFAMDLENSLKRRGIAMQKQQLKMKELAATNVKQSA